MAQAVEPTRLVFLLAALALPTVSNSSADVLAEFPLECRITEPPDYSATKQQRELVLLIERATARSGGPIFSYPKDDADKRRGGIIFPQFGYFVNVVLEKDLLQATDSMTRRDRLQLRREAGGILHFDLTVGSNRLGGAMQGTCRKTQIAASRFPFRDSQWPPPSYAEARLYQYNAESRTSAPIHAQGKFTDSIVKSVKLSDEQIRRLVIATTGKHPDHPVAACYIPRHAFVFLDSKGQPVSFAEVCFECSNYRLSNSEPNRFDLKALGGIVQEAGMPLR